MATKVHTGKRKAPPGLDLRPRPALRPEILDMNQASPDVLLEQLNLPSEAVERIVNLRRERPIRDAADLAEITGLKGKAMSRLAERAVGLLRPQVVLQRAAISGEHLYSDQPWAIQADFLPPNGGQVAVVSLEVRWRGKPFTVQRAVTVEENSAGSVRFDLGKEHALPPGPSEISFTLYDSLGGASSRRIPVWVLPSNPFTLFVSPGNRSIYNGSVRPDWSPPNWTTAIDLTFVNGDGLEVRLQRPMTWKFWDGGVGGTLVESGNFTWPETIVVPAFGTYSGWMTFTSPPGSGIFERYEDREDMTIEIIFEKQDGTRITGTVTCRIMAGWGVNIIQVGSYSNSERNTINAGIDDARDVYENYGLTISSERWWIISTDEAGGYTVLNDHDEWEDLLDDWTVPNDSVDCFIVRGMWDSYAGWSPIPGPSDKDEACEDDGLAATFSMVCITHELGHYMGGLEHADSLGSGNVMNSVCGGRNFTYDQYKKFFDHKWTRIVR